LGTTGLARKKCKATSGDALLTRVRSTAHDTGSMSAAILCIDMQNDFCLPTGKLFVAEASTCIPHCANLISFARQRQVPVFWIIREHDASGISLWISYAERTSLLRGMPDEHHSLAGDDVEVTRQHLYLKGREGAVIAGSFGSKLVEGLHMLDCEQVVVKKRFSAFFQTHLDLMLRRYAIWGINASAAPKWGHDSCCKLVGLHVGRISRSWFSAECRHRIAFGPLPLMAYHWTTTCLWLLMPPLLLHSKCSRLT
jgi:nicotinamidase-related amidase